jgi:hypothetical protein
MDSGNRGLPALPNALFLAGSGVAVLIAKSVVLSPIPRYLIAGAAVVWGFYLLGRDRSNQGPGWTSIAAGAGLAVFGGLVSVVSGLVGAGLIVAGAVSFIAGFFRGKS